jgi:hypothetical protein
LIFCSAITFLLQIIDILDPTHLNYSIPIMRNNQRSPFIQTKVQISNTYQLV